MNGPFRIRSAPFSYADVVSPTARSTHAYTIVRPDPRCRGRHRHRRPRDARAWRIRRRDEAPGPRRPRRRAMIVERAGRDIRHAWRMVSRMPMLTAVVIVSLAAGI